MNLIGLIIIIAFYEVLKRLVLAKFSKSSN